MTNEELNERCRRGLAFLEAGLTTDSKTMLTEILGRLHEKMTNPNVSAADQIAAAEALGKLLIDPHFPDHWFEAQGQ